MNIRVLIVDDHQIMREGLKLLLENKDGFEVVGEAENGRLAVHLAREVSPHVVLMDITMPEMNGVDATRAIVKECPSVRVLALSMHAERNFIEDVLAAGAKGFLLKQCAFEELVGAIHHLVNDRHYISPYVTDIVVTDYLHRRDRCEESPLNCLTPREREVLRLIAEGNNTKEVAFALNVSAKTVETQRSHIMKKLKATSVADLTKHALREGLITLT